MKKPLKLILILFIVIASTPCFAQGISLGDDAQTVYNILYSEVSSYNRSQGGDDLETFDVKHFNGLVSEITIGMKDAYIYDLRLKSDFARHYFMKDGLLDYISTQYGNLSIDQLKNSFDQQYGDRHIDRYYFSDDYKTYKTIFLASNGLVTIEERSTAKGHFPLAVKSKVQKTGDIPITRGSTLSHINQNAIYRRDGSGLLPELNRECILRPNVDNPNHIVGKIVVDLQVDKFGNVIYAHAGASGTTITDTTLLRNCEQAVLNSKFSPSNTAPDKQKAAMSFIFKASN